MQSASRVAFLELARKGRYVTTQCAALRLMEKRHSRRKVVLSG